MDIFTIQETKASSVGRSCTINMWGRKPFDFIHKPAVESACGILVA